MTDGAAVESGFRVDNIAIDGTDDRDRREPTRAGCSTASAPRPVSDVSQHTNAYFVDNRQYVGGDKTLGHLYNFAGFAKRPNWVDFFYVLAGCADHLLGQLVLRQQRRRAPRSRRGAAGRRQPAVRPRARRFAAPAADLLARRGVRAQPDQAGRPPRTTVSEYKLRRSRGPAALRRHDGLVVRQRRARVEHRDHTRATTSPAGTASTCPRPAPPSRWSRSTTRVS